MQYDMHHDKYMYLRGEMEGTNLIVAVSGLYDYR